MKREDVPEKNPPSLPSSSHSWKAFSTSGNRFLEKTNEHVLQGLNPGGIYQAIWCRDAAYILKDWFLSGNVDGVMQHIYQIWSHQIEPKAEKVVYGRGSPEMKFSAEVASEQRQKEFQGALPTTIYQAGFSEVYGRNPDIDSTALIISTTSWILARAIRNQHTSSSSSNTSTLIASEHSSDYVSSLLSKVGITDPSKVAEFVLPRMLKAVQYLNIRDIDNDGLLEQGHNEDWMDTALRAGKIVYTQACWILALNDLSSLLAKLGRRKESDRLIRLADKTIRGIEERLWSEEDGCYIDIQESPHLHAGQPHRLLTQDISYYLIAISQNTANDSLTIDHERLNNDNRKAAATPKREKIKRARQEDGELIPVHESLHKRAISTLEAIRKRAWKEKWPLVTESELQRTGPWVLKPYQYHNHTFWPWTTGIEMLARSRFNRVEECDILLSKLASEGHPHIHAFYEWINPITDEGSGAYPFRTGITAIRIALADILEKLRKASSSSLSA
jgi:hypothetical protein